ncbi:D-alanyl-D-alanine carboxypeptidase family protein [Franzmannia pantelleriensis]|nr:D-alanyl-D-alanine carboxypeptidase family protein [Halomonas pantelleriensis]
MLLVVSSAQANPRYAAIVVDSQNGEVLHSANADATRYPASLTKMMTLYLAFEAVEEGRLSLDQPLPVSSYAASMQPSKLGVKAGDSITLRDAIPALIIRSANDVAVVVAEALGGTESQFGDMMTAKARSLGMHNTYFRNASGLPDSLQTSTARDLATLSVRLMNDFPGYYHYFANASFTYRGQTINGHNRLLRNYPGADGLKTGFIRASGFNVATSAVRDGRRIVAVVMGGFTAQSRDDHMMTLLDRGFMRAALNDQNGWVAETNIAQPMETLVASVQGASSDLPSQPPTTALADLQTQSEAASEPLRLITALDARPRTSEASAAADALADTAPASVYRDDDDPILAVLSASGIASEGSIEQGSWAIQVGAYQDFDKARASASRAADYLSADQALSRVAVTEVESSDRTFFRARLVDLQENQARETCHRLAQSGMDCQVVTP